MASAAENNETREEDEEKMDKSGETTVTLKEGLCLKRHYGHPGFVFKHKLIRLLLSHNSFYHFGLTFNPFIK